jgi:very-short-patch-repair endonuclease
MRPKNGLSLEDDHAVTNGTLLSLHCLEKVTPKKGAPHWVLSSSKDIPAVFNKTLFLALGKMCNLKVNPNLFEEDVPDELYGAQSFIEKTHALLNEYGIRCEIAADAKDQELDRVPEFNVKELPEWFSPGKVEVCQYAVLGHFPQSDSSIQRDYDKFLEFTQEQLDAVTCFLSPELYSSAVSEDGATHGSVERVQNVDLPGADFPDDSAFTKTIDERKETDNFFLLPSDSSQDRILLELTDAKTTGMVVWGPPGTGKSQTIVNIIGDCLARGKTVLLVSQKRAALDVVYDRLGLKNLSNLVGLVHDSKADRKPLYQKINQETSQGIDASGRLPAIPVDPSGRLEQISATLKDVFKAYNDDVFGLKLGEIYHRLGGKKEGVIPLEPIWKSKKLSELAPISMQLRALQNHVRVASVSPLFEKRISFSAIENHELGEICGTLKEITEGEELLEASAILAIHADQKAISNTLVVATAKVTAFTETVTLFRCYAGIGRFFSWSYWKSRLAIQRHVSHAKGVASQHAGRARKLLNRLLDAANAGRIVDAISRASHDRKSLREFVETIESHFYEIKSYDLALEALPEDVRNVVSQIEAAIKSGAVARSENWGEVFERSVFALWSMELEKKHPVITMIRSGQIDALRQEYKELLKTKVDYCVHRLKEKVKGSLSTPDGARFRREINTDVNKQRNTFSIRKLNEKYLERQIYRSLLPIWLVSPETVSDAFPLIKGLFDVVIFDEASQCTVEHGLPAIYRGKQVIIAGDEKQLPPSNLFASRVDEDDGEENEDAHATDEPSLLTLAKKTMRYKAHMLEWHYRSKFQELITFSNEVFYAGRMKIAPNVIPFQKGNRPAIHWHAVSGYWEDRTNRQEAEKVIEQVRHFLSLDKPPSVGVITFNAPQKELILDLIDEKMATDPEFAELIEEDRQRPVDAQLFVKNIENVQGDEREVIIFSVAYARSEPNGRVNQNFGSLNTKGGENRLNVAVTRAIQRIEVVASIEPERDLDVSMAANQGPKVLKNYLCFAHAVAHEKFDRVSSLLSEINPNLQIRTNGGANVIESPFEAEVLQELQRLGHTVHTQVGQSGFRIDMAIVHPNDSGRYLLGIECDGAMYHSGISVRERDVFRQKFLEDRGWAIHRIWSTNWWDNRQKEISKLRVVIENALRDQRPAAAGKSE